MRCDGLVAEVQDWAASLDEVHARIAGRFARGARDWPVRKLRALSRWALR